MFGVFRKGWPAPLIASQRWSSVKTKMKFGRSAARWATPGRAVETRHWQQGDREDFAKGTLKNVSLRSDGRLSLGPVIRELYDSSTPYLWAVAEDADGNLLAGGGGPGSSTAKLYRIDPGGKARVLAELPGMEIHAIAIRKNQIYAATSPDGKVYKVSSAGKWRRTSAACGIFSRTVEPGIARAFPVADSGPGPTPAPAKV